MQVNGTAVGIYIIGKIMHLRKYPLLILFLIQFHSLVSHAHGTGPRGMQPLDWHTEQISQVNAFFHFSSSGKPRTEKIAGKNCMSAPLLEINVLDHYAYDIDETVEVEVEFDLDQSSKNIVFQYDKNGEISAKQKIELPKEGNERWYRYTFTLDRARFAGRSSTSPNFSKGDISIGTPLSYDADYVTICDITLKRSYTTSQPIAYGRLALQLTDEDGSELSARVGLYDSTGRMPLPGPEAIPVRYFTNITRTVNPAIGSVAWPVKNRHMFYVNGRYHSRLPVGTYDLVIARGLEYRIVQKSIEIKAEKETSTIIALSRWTDMSTKGWYSGDAHIHYSRTNIQDSNNVRLHIEAEDINVANLLQMGNIGTVHHQQYNWGKESRFGEAPYMLVSGQEDPRTLRRGHTIQLNINEPVRNPKRYYLYHEVFEEVHKQAGLTGYAHAGGARILSGLALDVPFGLVDFVEVLQAAQVSVQYWFDFLNLGYKLSPAAGSDYPYLAIPGAVRNYVELENGYSVQGWFDGLQAGKTFVTNGPMLDLTINGQGMGSTLKVDKGAVLTIKARAKINPDIDQLDRIEIIQQGEVVARAISKNGAQELHIQHEIRADHGNWFVLKAQGKQEKKYESIVAVSAPIYVTMDGSGFCKPSAIPSIVINLKEQIKKMLAPTVEEQYDYEAWETHVPRKKYWPENKELLQKRADEVSKIYDELIRLASNRRCITN